MTLKQVRRISEANIIGTPKGVEQLQACDSLVVICEKSNDAGMELATIAGFARPRTASDLDTSCCLSARWLSCCPTIRFS
jgi:hypothetical protein